MPIDFLYNEYKRDPNRVEKLLDEKIEITEKLDGSRFLVQAQEGGTLTFYKRKDMSITKIDRTLSKYYESAILHFDNFSKEKIAELPVGWRFGMEYFPNLHPVTITYDRLPLNNLVLTDIQVKDPKDRTIDVITDKETLKKWADTLEVEHPPIIFEGKLTTQQKTKILDFLNTPFSSLVKRFKTENFTRFILTLLNPQLKSSFLNSDIEKDIDGLIFKFDGKESFKVSDPEISLQKAQKREEKPSDIYNLTLVILNEFITGLDFNKIKLKEKTYEERYIEFISKAYNLFLKTPEYKKNFEKGVDFDLPKFLSRAESDVNFSFVKDPETQEELKKSSTNRELFKILMASMRSHKKRPSGFFTKELITHHNDLVDKIADYVDFNKKSLRESSVCSFEEFKKVFLIESSTWQEEFGKESLDESEIEMDISEDSILTGDYSEVSFPTYKEVKKSKVLDNVSKPLGVLKKMLSLDRKEKKDEKKKTPVCLITGKFQPFHNGHVVVIEDAASVSGNKIFLVVTSKRLANNGLTRELHKSMLDEALKDNKNVCGYVFSDGRSLNEIARDLPEKYEPKSFAGSVEECEDAHTQIGLDTFPMTRHVHSNEVIERIKNEDFDGYKKLVPESIHNYFYKIKNELSE